MHARAVRSVRPTQSGVIAVNLDNAFTAVLSAGSLLSIVPAIIGRSPATLNAQDIRQVKGLIYGAKYARSPPSFPTSRRAELYAFACRRFTRRYSDQNKVFKINGVSLRPAGDESFTIQATGLKQTVPQFFASHYNVTLTKPGWPCVKSSSSNPLLS